MTSTVPRQTTARLGSVYAYDVRIGGVVVANAYIGRARDVERRDRQHRGLAPQRDGQVREQPWADQIVRLRVLATGVWTDAELDAEEVRLIHALRPVLNDRDNRLNPNRIPIYVQHEQRKARDPNWVVPDWRRPPLSGSVPGRPMPVSGCFRTVWRWLSATLPFRAFVSWLLLTLAVCVAVAWGSHAVGRLVPIEAALIAGAAVSLGLHIWQWKRIRRWLRRL